MALTTYAGLKTAALKWIEHEGAPGATDIIDDCVTLCEARLAKMPTFRLSSMETELVLTLADGSASLPSDFLAMKRVVSGIGTGGAFSEGFDEGFAIGTEVALVQTSPKRLLTYAEPGWYDQAYPFIGTDDDTKFYTIVGSTLRAQIDSVGILYYARIPALATTDPNWLLTRSPDIYLYGTIMEVLNALEGDATGKYAGLFTSAVDSLIASETFSRGGVLTMRASMATP